MLSDDEILAAIESGERAYRDHKIRVRGTMMLPGDHSPEYWIARAVERAAAERMRERCMAVCSALADALPTFDFNELSPDNVLRDEAFYTAYDAIAEIKIEGEAP